MPIAGVDEVGYGAWAGPIIVAAVIINQQAIKLTPLMTMIKDSKQLSFNQRETIYEKFVESPDLACWATASVSVEELTVGNVLHETLRAMTIAVSGINAAGVIVDGCHGIPCQLPQKIIPNGDQKSLSVALASILAKVTRDRLMCELAKTYPGFLWEKNKGYGTLAHRKAILCHGLTPHHRVKYCHKFLAASGKI